MSEFWNLYSGNCEDQNLLVCDTMCFGREQSEFLIKLLAYFSTLKTEAVGAADIGTYVRQSRSHDIRQHRHLSMYNVTIYCTTMRYV